ncbi:MAG: sulfatase, partial [Opitutaceae bacterium]
MKRFIVLCSLAVVTSAFSEARAADRKPNILWVIGDDLGVELGCYGYPMAQTPNIDRLAREGRRYSNAFTTAPVCSASRSAFITGMYQTRINCQDHRTMLMKPLPEGVHPITTYLRAAGYTCVDVVGLGANGKEDFNFKPADVFDSKDLAVMEKTVADGKPLFAQVNFFEPHRKFTALPSSEKRTDPTTVTLPPLYPDHPVARQDWADYMDAVRVCDAKVGRLLAWLEERKIADNTVIFFFGDNGRPHVWDKQWLSDSGLRVPLLVRWPGRVSPGAVDSRLVSIIDVSAETLVAAGVSPLPTMDGREFIGPHTRPRDFAFGARDRCGEAFDRIRSVHDGRYNYIRNYYPEMPYWQRSRYKEKDYPVFTLLKALHTDGKLTPAQDRFFADAKPVEELYDLQNDPGETRNVAADPAHAAALLRLRQALAQWQREVPDAGATPESPDEYALAASQSKKQYAQLKNDDWDRRTDVIVEALKA